MTTVKDDWRPFCWVLKYEDGQCKGMGRYCTFRDHCLNCPFMPEIPEWFTNHPQKGQVK
jgi:hypothetical protein